MTEKELKKLNRTQLLELLLQMASKLEETEAELADAKIKLEDKTIAIDKAGSIAEASIQVSGVLIAAQGAAQRYIENIESLSARQKEVCEKMEAESAGRCLEMEAKTKALCEKMIEKAKEEADRCWEDVAKNMKQLLSAQSNLRNLFAMPDTTIEGNFKA